MKLEVNGFTKIKTKYLGCKVGLLGNKQNFEVVKE